MELQKSIRGIVAAQPGITLALCIKAFEGVFPAGDVHHAVNTLAAAGAIRVEGVVDQLGSGLVGNVRLWPKMP